MEATDDTRTDLKAKTERREFIAQLRQLADWLSEHPDVTVHSSWGYVASVDVAVFNVSKDQISDAARTGGPWEKNYAGEYFELCREFGDNVKFSLNCEREQVCERVQVGVEQETVPDPSVIDTRPSVVIDKPVYEWRCKPLLETSE